MRLQLLTAGLAFLLGMAPVETHGSPLSGPLPNMWRVWLKEDAERSAKEHAKWASSMHNTHSGGLAGVRYVLDPALGAQSYVGEFTDYVINIIRKDEDVSSSMHNY